ncbi:MAG: ParB/RepB/Spo0J family partition protein [Clostridia bacterium]|nr:ParB/RepB/Spo0J family partition protein [Clostridia bacterium]
MFMDDAGRAENKLKKIYEIPLSEIDDFPDHPYLVKDDEDMDALKESIRERGVITPLLIRQKDDDSGRYEIISGHRRKHACELLGIETVKCDVLECTRDEAIILMVDSNAQRSFISPCEKGRAYKMKLEAIKRLPGRPSKENGSPVDNNLKGTKSASLLADENGDGQAQIYRLIRLTELTSELQEVVDDGRMKLRPAVELSYVDEETQRNVMDRILETDATPSHDQAIRIRRAYEEGYATYECIRDIMDEDKPNQRPKYNFKYERLSPLIPTDYTPQMAEDYVVKALEYYKKYLQKQRENSR